MCHTCREAPPTTLPCITHQLLTHFSADERAKEGLVWSLISMLSGKIAGGDPTGAADIEMTLVLCGKQDQDKW